MSEETWKQIEAVQLTWPERKRLPLGEALGSFGMESISSNLLKLVEHLQILEGMEPAPIVAVLGSLNGGKSSCVAGFLSPAGQARIPRGNSSECGTHRFIFWLPKKWDDRATEGRFWASVQGQLNNTFGGEVEFLSDDPAVAALQYNGGGDVRGHFTLPLIAFDERLDELNLCLLDCPDVESRMDHQTSQERLEVLQKSSGLMQSVVFLVHTMDLRADILGRLAQTFQDRGQAIAKFLLINCVRSSQGSIVNQVSDPAVEKMKKDFGAGAVFVAYDFEANDQSLFPSEAAKQSGLPDKTPWFFQASMREEENSGDAVGVERMLISKIRQLNAGKLWERSIEDQRKALGSQLQATRTELLGWIAAEREEVRKCRDHFLSFLQKQMTDRQGNLQIPYTPELLRQIGESIYRTVPLWAKPSLWIGKNYKAFISGLASLGEQVKQVTNPTGEVQEQFSKAKEALADHKGKEVLDAADFAERSRSLFPQDILEDKKLVEAWGKAMEVFAEVSGNLPEEKMDKATTEIWKSVPFSKKLFFAASAPVAVAGGAVFAGLALVDMGTSAVLLAPGLAQLAGIAGVGAVAMAYGTVAGKNFDDLLRTHFAVPAYGRFVAAACDVFGLPRELDEPVEVFVEKRRKAKLDLKQHPSLRCVLRVTKAKLAGEISGSWDEIAKSIAVAHKTHHLPRQ